MAAINTVLTYEGLNHITEAVTNGFYVFPIEFAVSSVSSGDVIETGKARTYADMNSTWITKPISSILRTPPNSFTFICELIIGEPGIFSNKPIAEIYIIGQDDHIDPVTGLYTKFLLTVSKPSDDIFYYYDSGSITLRIAVTIDNAVSVPFEIHYSQSEDVFDHNWDDNAHVAIQRSLATVGGYVHDSMRKLEGQNIEFNSVWESGVSADMVVKRGTDSWDIATVSDGDKPLGLSLNYIGSHTWLPNTPYLCGTFVTPVTKNGHTYIAAWDLSRDHEIISSGLIEPDWNLEEASSTPDGDITWIECTKRAVLHHGLVQTETVVHTYGVALYLSSTNPGEITSDITAIKVGISLGGGLIYFGSYGYGSFGSNTSKEIYQPDHGFDIGSLVKFDGSIYAHAKADSSPNAEVVGIVCKVSDEDNFELLVCGYLSGLTGLTAGVYFLSDTSAGEMTLTETTTAGHVSKPVFHAVSDTDGYFINMRGLQIAASSTSHYLSFDDSDLAAGILSVNHSLGHEYVSVTCYNDLKVNVDLTGLITIVDSNNLTVNLSSFGVLTGIWNLIVLD